MSDTTENEDPRQFNKAVDTVVAALRASELVDEVNVVALVESAELAYVDIIAHHEEYPEVQFKINMSLS